MGQLHLMMTATLTIARMAKRLQILLWRKRALSWRRKRQLLCGCFYRACIRSRTLFERRSGTDLQTFASG
jgi:hypothetical protein